MVAPGTPDLAAFLRARLDEDAAEAEADEALAHEQATGWLPERVLRDVAAKRRIIDEIVPVIDELDALLESERGSGAYKTSGESDRLLKLLALLYADHPDYDEEWRP